MLREGPAALQERALSILMVLESNFTQTGGGGAESQVRTLSLHMKRLGQHVTIMTPMLPEGRQIQAERCYGIPIGRLTYPRQPKVGGAVMCLKFAAFLVRNRRRYDVWHVHIGHHLGAVACLLGSVLGKPVVLKISGSWELETGLLSPSQGFVGGVGRRWLQRATAVQAISTRIAGELRRCGFPSERIIVLPNAVDMTRFGRRPTPRKPGAPFVGVFVGRLVGEKGLPTLLEAWGEAFRGRDGVVLRLVGGGPMEPELRGQARRLGIESQVQFVGPCDRVESVLSEAHVGILPSRIEGLSNTLLEFMACGLPVLATAVSGSEDFVKTGRNGWLVPVSDGFAMAACLREAEALPGDRLAQLGEAARLDVEAAASLDVVVGTLLSVYRGTHPSMLETG